MPNKKRQSPSFKIGDIGRMVLNKEKRNAFTQRITRMGDIYFFSSEGKRLSAKQLNELYPIELRSNSINLDGRRKGLN